MTYLRDLGEDGWIQWLREHSHATRSVQMGIGDDCAIVHGFGGYDWLLTSDMLVEGVHFHRRGTSAVSIGHKALGAALSDIASMGGTPRWALVSFGAPASTRTSFAQDVYRGIQRLAKRFDVAVVGGDTSTAEQVVIDVAVMGEVRRRHVITRGGAKPGDRLFVTGSLGGSKKGRHLKFMPRIEAGQRLAREVRPTSMIDVSDGLARDVMRIAEASSVGIVISAEQIPLAKAAQGRVQRALSDGEDFELLFTVSPKRTKRLLSLHLGVRISEIGRVVPAKDGVVCRDRRGRERRLDGVGYRHF